MNNLGSLVSYLDPDNIQSIVNKVKNAVMNLSEYEIKVRDATGPENWGASSTLMMEISTGTFNYAHFTEIMDSIYKRFEEKGVTWRQIYKTLQLLEYLIKNGSERVVDNAREHGYDLRALTKFQYVDEKGKDQGINVRNRAKEIVDLLADTQKIKDERKKARINRSKYTGVASDGRSVESSQYIGFGRDTPMRSSTPGGFQDDLDEGSATKTSDSGRTQRSSSSAASTNAPSLSLTTTATSDSINISKAAPAPPKVANLLDFEAPHPPPAIPPISSSMSPQTTATLVDDWSDFTTTTNTTTAASCSAEASKLKTANLVDDFADFTTANPPLAQTKMPPQQQGFTTFNGNGVIYNNNNTAATAPFAAFTQPQPQLNISTNTTFATFASFSSPAPLIPQQQQFSSLSTSTHISPQPTIPSSRSAGGDVFGSLVSLDAVSLGSASGGKNANDLGPSLNALKTIQTHVIQRSIGVAGIPMAQPPSGHAQPMFGAPSGTQSFVQSDTLI
ncbi:hypothetical protein SeMB42_g03159 [Synchytrium endobioticum]|uniref:ENTH domain-containing protein n=1 Tax=Synchytrium endobioticum TaxID=286115 RepID=A0A507D8L6_9FUNG|nr:hypothetical protein SeMB42_g03159 [Synchytrium endobioticum]TPX49403.1 hypothetical protein SeLEV6574_g01497 [Synchytrium endobioticum]